MTYCFVPGHFLRNFTITVGPHNGAYKKCGSDSNAMSDEDRKSFVCEPDTIGTSLTINMTAIHVALMVCEVQILGKGIILQIITYIVTL